MELVPYDGFEDDVLRDAFQAIGLTVCFSNEEKGRRKDNTAYLLLEGELVGEITMNPSLLYPYNLYICIPAKDLYFVSSSGYESLQRALWAIQKIFGFPAAKYRLSPGVYVSQ